MKATVAFLVVAVAWCVRAETIAPLPAEVGSDPMAVMALDDAWHVSNACRARYLLSGLWQHAEGGATNRWDWVKLPNQRGSRQAAQLYRRVFRTPAEAKGRRVTVTFPLLNGDVRVRVDGVDAGGCGYPSGTVDVTRLVKPGELQIWSIEQVKKPQIGVTADFYLDLEPAGARLEDPWTVCSVARGEIAFHAESCGLPSEGVKLIADVTGCGETRRFESGVVKPDARGVVSFTAAWPDAKRWDLHTPSNLYDCALSVRDLTGRELDRTVPFRFGFREVRAEGNKLLLNGIPLHLRFLLAPMACAGDGLCSKAGAAECCARLKGEGYNAVTDQYGTGPGAYKSLESVFQACDEAGVVYFHTLPHAAKYDRRKLVDNEPGEVARYRREAEALVKIARNHPCVLAYVVNHNYTGYTSDTDPMKMDGLYAPDGKPGFESWNRVAAHRTYEIVKSLDPTRLAYHHSSGNLDDFYTVNCYLDWAPRQERSEWVAHWATNGVKPLFFVEWGMPHTANWSSFRGPAFIWENEAFQSVVAAEGAAAFRGDAAYEDSAAAHAVLAHDENLWARKRPWNFRDEQQRGVFTLTNNFHGVMSYFMEDNLRCLRAWGLTAILPWDQRRAMHNRVAPTVRTQYADRYRDLKQPGLHGEWVQVEDQYILDGGPRTNWVRTCVSETIARWSQDDCCFIGGAGCFTDKRHIYRPGETVRKTLVFVNDRRTPVEYGWNLTLTDAAGAEVGAWRGTVRVAPGTRGEVPVSCVMPTAGAYRLSAAFSAPGWKGSDAFVLTALAPATEKPSATIQLYDTKGLTAKLFTRLGIPFSRITTLAEVRKAKRNLVIGRESLTADVLDAILSERYNSGQALVFEQSEETLVSLGFRVQEYGLRETYPRFADPLVPLTAETCRDWAGASTLVPGCRPSIDDNSFVHARWAGFKHDRVFRCGNRGAVATLMIEKPTIGDWRPLLDGGWDLQYSPLMAWRCDFGEIVFCQCDVTARTEVEPAADELVRRLVARLTAKRNLPASWCKAYGQQAWWAAQACRFGQLQEQNKPGRDTYIVSSGAEKSKELDKKVHDEGARVVCVGLNAEETRAWAPVHVDVKDVKGQMFTRFPRIDEMLNGCSNAEIAWHGAMDFAAFTCPSPTGVPALRVVRHGKGCYIFMQVAPWMIDDVTKPYLRATKRRAWFLFNRICGNAGISSRATRPAYADAPQSEDDPYRYFRW